MNILDLPKEQGVFQTLLPDTVLNLVEDSLGVRCSNLCRPLNSYINRVYELKSEEGQGLIIKFYRPGRWSLAALGDEHDFLLELAEQEIPVVAPLHLQDGRTLGSYQGIPYAVFPKRGGRSFDEYSDDQWLELGRLVGRTHAVGATHHPKERIILTPDIVTTEQVGYILQGNFMDADLAQEFQRLAGMIVDHIKPLFQGVAMSRIHGDCHFSNLICRPGESFYLIDFDDMAVGPPVQDLWMLLPHYADKSLVEIDLFLEGYETFHGFDRRTLRLIEPLRAMRYIHYIAWCAHQVKEDGVSRAVPDFGGRHYWLREIKDLSEQLDRILDMPEHIGGF